MRPCLECGEDFKPTTANQRICSVRCRNRRNKKLRSVTVADRQRQYRANRKARGLAAQTWTPALRDAYHRRRALKATGDLGIKVHFTEIAKRDGWRCGICGLDVDPSLTWPDQMSGSIDHVVPLSKGGAHEEANVQLAHVRCNSGKRDRLAS